MRGLKAFLISMLTGGVLLFGLNSADLQNERVFVFAALFATVIVSMLGSGGKGGRR